MHTDAWVNKLCPEIIGSVSLCWHIIKINIPKEVNRTLIAL